MSPGRASRPKDLVAIPLDFADLDSALAMVDVLGDQCSLYKVGLELYCQVGPRAVRALRERGKDVFLDLKLHDIPHTVAKAVERCAEQEVRFLTVHIGGGAAMLAGAQEAAAGRVGLLGVTVLTSFDAQGLGQVWGRDLTEVEAEVLRLAGLARDAGLAGVVCSAQEASRVRGLLGDAAEVVTPGIRLRGDSAHDQRRVCSPGEAMAAGASRLVVGRSITAAEDPASAFGLVLDDALCVGPAAPS